MSGTNKLHSCYYEVLCSMSFLSDLSLLDITCLLCCAFKLCLYHMCMSVEVIMPFKHESALYLIAAQ